MDGNCALPRSARAMGRKNPTRGARKWTALTAELDDPEDWARIEAALAEGDIQAKSFVQREMGLP